MNWQFFKEGDGMLCQNCGKKEATTHIKQIFGGEMSENHLCRDCASHLGYGDMLPGFGLNISQLLSGFAGDFDLPAPARETLRCPKCGASFGEIVSTGNVGCSECYHTFYERLLPIIEQTHGKSRHTPSHSSPVKEKEKTKEEKIAALRLEMSSAVSREDFETAAALRDQIKTLEGGETQ
ncbi:MAG: UvrB/UvrC motif-containing protein [Clostridiales bacterium]|nr:UvrB/UvrC motif-containing protein [Clostridiales bacterium]